MGIKVMPGPGLSVPRLEDLVHRASPEQRQRRALQTVVHRIVDMPLTVRIGISNFIKGLEGEIVQFQVHHISLLLKYRI